MGPRTAGIGLLIACAALPALADGGVDVFRTQMEKWVETRQIISEEKADWQVEKELLQASRDLLRREKEALELEIAELEESNTASDEERRELLLERGDSQQASRALEDEIRALELDVQSLAPQLPEPLQKRLEPLLVQIPDDPERSELPLGQRLMSVLGVLAQAEKWNATATFVGETRSVNGGPRVQVRTLYWGLAQAVFVDAQAHSAGVGRPAASGWEFSEDPRLVGEAKQLLDIYEGNVDVIDFVELPVEIR